MLMDIKDYLGILLISTLERHDQLDKLRKTELTPRHDEPTDPGHGIFCFFEQKAGSGGCGPGAVVGPPSGSHG